MGKRKKSKGRRKKRYNKFKKHKRLFLLAVFIVIFSIGLLVSYFAIDYVYGWSYEDRSLDGSSVTQGLYYGKADTLHLNDPERFGLCFADVSFHLSYTEGTFLFYLLVVDKSQLNLNMEFLGSNGGFYEWNHIESEIPEENIWYKFEYVYNFANNISKFLLNNVEIEINGTVSIPTSDFNRVFIKTNDDGICDLYINIENVS